MNTDIIPLTPALAFLAEFWRLHNKAHVLDGYHRDHAVAGIVRHMILYGVVFHEDDFVRISARVDAWKHGNLIYYCVTEQDYAAACGCNRGLENMSAARAIEKKKCRKPFILRWDPEIKTASRVYVGAELVWRGERVKCTSFAADQSHFVACSYKPREFNEKGYVEGERKVKNLHKITHDMIREYHSELRSEKAT